MTPLFAIDVFRPGDIVDTPVGLGVIPCESLEMAWELQYGLPQNHEVRFIGLKNGEIYTMPDNYVKVVHGVVKVDNDH